MIPVQDSMFNELPWPGWRNYYNGPAANPFSIASYIMTNGSVQVDKKGPDLPILGSSDPAENLVTLDFMQETFHLGFLYNFSSYRLPTFRSNLAIYPGTYALNGWTYGYVQDNVVDLGDLGNVYVAVPWLGHMADINLNLIVGVNLTLTMVFRTEGLISGIPYNSSVRIRVFDDDDRLVAATTLIGSDAGALQYCTEYCTDSTEYYSDKVGFFANGINIANKVRNAAVPGGTRTLTYKNLAGSFEYVEPSNPIIGLRTVTLFSGDHGIWGRSFHRGGYSGDWTIMVDVVNWYRNNTGTTPNYYPPVPGLLQGESPYFFPYNHLGPYARSGFIRIMNAPLTGEGSAEFGLDLRGYIQGTILEMNWDNDVRTASWISLLIVNSTAYQYYWYTWDGWVDGYLDPGTYRVTMSEWTKNEGHLPVRFTLNVNRGQQASINYILDESQIPIPEFPMLSLNLLCLSITVCLMRVWRTKKRK
jgi:hypothetical protein